MMGCPGLLWASLCSSWLLLAPPGSSWLPLGRPRALGLLERERKQKKIQAGSPSHPWGEGEGAELRVIWIILLLPRRSGRRGCGESHRFGPTGPGDVILTVPNHPLPFPHYQMSTVGRGKNLKPYQGPQGASEPQRAPQSPI